MDSTPLEGWLNSLQTLNAQLTDVWTLEDGDWVWVGGDEGNRTPWRINSELVEAEVRIESNMIEPLDDEYIPPHWLTAERLYEFLEHYTQRGVRFASLGGGRGARGSSG